MSAQVPPGPEMNPQVSNARRRSGESWPKSGHKAAGSGAPSRGRGASASCLIGPSGCGKSTFLRILNRMHEMVPGASLGGQIPYNTDMKTRQNAQAGRRLDSLISAVRAAMRTGASWAETADLVADVLWLQMPGAEILTAEQRDGDPAGYRCHLLHGEPDGSFSVVALVWRPGQATPIHDHVTWCVFGVIQGAEREERYVLRDDGWLEQAGTVVNATGDVTALAPPGDIHQVRNDGAQTAISLHIYGTDIGRIGSSVRRIYDLPVIAGIPG